MNISTIDLHQDILLHQRSPGAYPDGYRNQTDFQQLQDADVRVVVGSGFKEPDPDDDFDADFAPAIERDFEEYQSIAEDSSDWRIITHAADVTAVVETENDASGIVMHIEGLNTFVGTQSQWERLQRWYTMGWRSVGIVWNTSNTLGGGTDDGMQGVTDLGADVIRWARERNMLIDLAHMNPPTFDNVLDIVDEPVIISHGNARGLVDTNRNYTDAQIRAIADTGGLVGVFFSAKNLGGNPQIQDILKQIDYIRSVVGIEHVAVGTDFGGLLGDPVAGLKQTRQLPDLWNALADYGFGNEAIKKVASENAARVLADVLP